MLIFNRFSELINDMFSMMCQTYLETDQTRKSELKSKLANNIIPLTVHYLEEKIRSTNTGYLVGDSLTWIDIYAFNVIEILGQNGKLILEKFPLLNKHFSLVKNIPSIANWLETRPNSDI